MHLVYHAFKHTPLYDCMGRWMEIAFLHLRFGLCVLGTACIVWYVTMHSKLPTHTIQNHPAWGDTTKHHLMLIWLLFSHFNQSNSQVAQHQHPHTHTTHTSTSTCCTHTTHAHRHTPHAHTHTHTHHIHTHMHTHTHTHTRTNTCMHTHTHTHTHAHTHTHTNTCTHVHTHTPVIVILIDTLSVCICKWRYCVLMETNGTLTDQAVYVHLALSGNFSKFLLGN